MENILQNINSSYAGSSNSDEVKKLWSILSELNDPEIPVLSITDLGIVRDIKMNGSEIEVVITPTYSGCPAMDVIAISIRTELLQHG